MDDGQCDADRHARHLFLPHPRPSPLSLTSILVLPMPLLIDGYNLLNATGIVGRGAGPPSLGRSRLALLNFLAASIDPRELPHTTVVFDAHDPPPGLPRVVQHGAVGGSLRPKKSDGRRIDRRADPRRFGPAAVGGRVERPRDSAGRATPQGEGGRQRNLVRRTDPRAAAAGRRIVRRLAAAARSAACGRRRLLAPPVRRRIAIDGISCWRSRPKRRRKLKPRPWQGIARKSRRSTTPSRPATARICSAISERITPLSRHRERGRG